MTTWKRRFQTADKVIAWIGYQVVAMTLALILIAIPVGVVGGLAWIVVWAWR
jgi:hypothetical protein